MEVRISTSMVGLVQLQQPVHTLGVAILLEVKKSPTIILEQVHGILWSVHTAELDLIHLLSPSPTEVAAVIMFSRMESLKLVHCLPQELQRCGQCQSEPMLKACTRSLHVEVQTLTSMVGLAQHQRLVPMTGVDTHLVAKK